MALKVWSEKDGDRRDACPAIEKRKIRRNVAGENPLPVVALIQKQADGVAFVETHLVTDAVLQNLKPFRHLAEDELR